jgi:hypothetical protein
MVEYVSIGSHRPTRRRSRDSFLHSIMQAAASAQLELSETEQAEVTDWVLFA